MSSQLTATNILSCWSFTVDLIILIINSVEQVGATVEGRESVFQMYTTASDVKLRMTRSFGDFYLKQNKNLPFDRQAVIAVPEVLVHTRHTR